MNHDKVIYGTCLILSSFFTTYIHLILYIIIPYILFIIIETLAIYEINYFQNMLIGILFNSFINKSNVSKNKLQFLFYDFFFQYAAFVPWTLPKMREKHNVFRNTLHILFTTHFVSSDILLNIYEFLPHILLSKSPHRNLEPLQDVQRSMC